MEAVVELFCFGSFVNITAPSADGIQTRVSCMGDLKMTAFVSTLLPKRRVRSKFIFKYRCGNSFSSVTNQDLQVDGSIGANFYQNAICNGTEQTMMKYSAHGQTCLFGVPFDLGLLGDLLSELIGTGGSFLVVHMGTCSEAATLLSSIDILGVFYSYVVIPGCKPEASPDRSKLYTQKVVPISMSCNGEKQNITKPCKGLLIGVTPIEEGTVSCKCRGNWAQRDEKFDCTGELYGEQERHGAMGSYTRSSVCAGKNTFEPIFVKDDKGRPLSGSNVTCDGAAVKSTIFGPSPYQRSAPFQRRL